MDWYQSFRSNLDEIIRNANAASQLVDQIERFGPREEWIYALSDEAVGISNSARRLVEYASIRKEPKFIPIHIGDTISVRNNGYEVKRGVVTNMDEAGQQVFFETQSGEDEIFYGKGGWSLEDQSEYIYDVFIENAPLS